jgi:hypothetical protein
MFSIGIVVNAVEGNTHLLIPLITVLICNVIVFLTPRKYEIYEKGMRYGLVFVGWDEVREIEWKNGVLKIKTGKIACIRIRDKNGNLKDVIEKYRM